MEIGEPKNSEEIVVSDDEAVKVVLHPASFSVTAIVRIVLITLGILIAVFAIGGIFYSLSFLLVLLALSIFLAYLIDPLVKLIRRPFKQAKLERFMPRSLAILISSAIVVTVLGLGVTSIAPIVVAQGKRVGLPVRLHRRPRAVLPLRGARGFDAAADRAHRPQSGEYGRHARGPCRPAEQGSYTSHYPHSAENQTEQRALSRVQFQGAPCSPL